MEANPHIARVMTIPGVGRKTAEMIVAYIDDPHRFKNTRQLSSYIGLTPKQHQSGETDRNGKISKHGPKLLRSALLQCAWSSLRYNPWSKSGDRTGWPRAVTRPKLPQTRTGTH